MTMDALYIISHLRGDEREYMIILYMMRGRSASKEEYFGGLSGLVTAKDSVKKCWYYVEVSKTSKEAVAAARETEQARRMAQTPAQVPGCRCTWGFERQGGRRL